MSEKIIRERRCVGCNKLKHTSEMIRIMKTYDDQKIIINPDSNHFGRSSYLCYNNDCLQSAIKRKRVPRSLKTKVSEDIMEKLKDIIDEKSK